MTTQQEDIIIVEGKEFKLLSHLECPEHHLEDDKDDPSWGAVCSSNWKGYLATWEIKDNRLYLLEITGSKKIVSTLPIFVDWFTGLVGIATGKYLKNINDLHSVYEREVHLELKDGLVVGKHEIKDGKNENLKTKCELCRYLLFYLNLIDDY